MASFEFATPDGAKYQVDAPDEATAISAFNSHIGGGDSTLGFKPTPSRTGSRLLDTFDAAIRGAANTFTMGGADRLAALMNPGSYSDNLKKEYATNDFDAKNNTAAKFTGDVAGFTAQLPFLPARLTAVDAATRIGRAGQGAAQGGVLAGAQGLGQSREDDLSGKVSDALKTGALGAVAGGAIGAILPRSGVPGGGNAIPPGAPNSGIVEAAERQGIALPTLAATDNKAVQQIGSYLEDLPFVGTPLQNARETAIKQAQDRLTEIGMKFGTADPQTAGSGIQQAIQRYSKQTLPAEQEAAYQQVTGLTSGKAQPLNQLQGAVADIAAKRQMGGLSDELGALSLVDNAIKRPGGLKPEGIQTLRTSIGEKLKNIGLNPNMSGSEAKQLYGAVTQDYRKAVETAGGPQAVKALEAADLLTKKGKERIASVEALARQNVGGEQATQTIANWALEGGRGNIKRLVDARRMASPQEWGDIAASAIQKMGVSGRSGEFSPAYLVSNWQKMSHAGKKALFGADPAHMRALEDIVSVAKGLQNLEQFANKSRSGVVATISGTTAGLMTAPLATLGAALGGRVLASALAKPVTAKSLATYSKAYSSYVYKPSAGAYRALQSRAAVFGEVMAKEFGVPANDVARMTLQHVRPAADEKQNTPVR